MQKSFILLSIVGALLISAAPTKYPTNSTIQLQREVTPCNNGYYWTSQSCMLCLTTPLANADTCTCTVPNTCTTLTCLTGYSPLSDNSACVPMSLPQGCLTYGQGPDAIVCYTCSPRYTLIGGVCIPSLSCITFNVTTGICQTCSDGLYLNYNTLSNNNNYDPNSGSLYFNQYGSQCSPCMYYCSLCSSSTTCQQCSTGYFWSVNGNNGNGNGQGNNAPNTVGACQRCANYCSTCTSNSVSSCTTCFANYFQDPNTKACATCSINGCQTCGSVSTCATCSSGYTITSDSTGCTANVVITCSNGCANCTNSSTCTSCSSNFALINSACYQCGTGCSQCAQLGTSTTTTCKICQDTYTLLKGNDQSVAGTCSLCSTSNNQWLRCGGQYEINVRTSLQPIECADNNFLVNVNGTQTCIAYQTPNTCLTIQNGDSNNCALCLPGYQKLISTNCQLCPGNCNTCAGSNGVVVCSQCQTGFYLSSDSKSCIQCSQGCGVCSSANTCTTCQSNNYLNAQGTCSQCSIGGCAVCPNNVCQSCGDLFYLYTLPSNTTSSSSSSSSSSTTTSNTTTSSTTSSNTTTTTNSTTNSTSNATTNSTNTTNNSTNNSTGNSTGSFNGTLVNSTNNSTTYFNGTFQGNLTGNFTGTQYGNATGNFTGNFTGNCTGSFIYSSNNTNSTSSTNSTTNSTNSTSNSTTNSTSNSTSNSTNVYYGTFVGNCSGTFNGTFTGNSTGNSTTNQTTNSTTTNSTTTNSTTTSTTSTSSSSPSGPTLQCNSCPAGCQTCLSPGQVCQSCQVGYVLQNQGCVSLSLAYCAQSDVVLGCTLCQYGFYLVDQQCYECIDPQTATVCRGNVAANVTPSTSVTPSGSGSSPTVSTVSSTSTGAQHLFAAIISLLLVIMQ